ncbi:MAG: hypothetical protein JSS83_05270, partial [Cyanobacteria bacterium SZAS LIN-3]|nr:hypothetical protein [Cyanobacteria bacterium SZAS LIN-3]
LLVNGPVRTTNGAVSIIASGSFLSVQDDVLAGSTSSKTKATVLLENSNKTSGYINIQNANIDTQGPGGGDVNIAIGTPSKGFNTVNPNPGPIVVQKLTANEVFFGTPGAVDPTSDGTLTVKGRNIIFTSNLANSIFFTNTKITADPPVGAANAAPVVAIASPVIAATPAITVTPTSSSIATSSLPAVHQISAPASVSLAALTDLGAMSQATNYLRSQAAYRMISETEMDGGEVPVALIHGGNISISDAATASAAELTDNEKSSKTLSRGSVLVMPTTDTTIHTQFGDVAIAAKSVALVIAVRDGLAVFNIDDRKSDAVTITSAGKKLSVQPGTSAFIASEAVRSYEHVNPAQLISHRRMYEQRLGNGMKAFRSEIALPTVFSALKPLRAMVQSQDKETRDMAEHLLKTTSILMQLQSGGEDFKRILKPQLTAYAQK